MNEPRYWFRQIHCTSWVAYDGRQAIDEAVTRGELQKRLKARGITDAVWIPLGIIRIL